MKGETHVYVEKIESLEITDELKIGKVIFMNFEKFKANKKWQSKFADKNEEYLKKWWGKCKAVAILPFSGEFKEKKDALKYQVQESIEILAFSAYPGRLNTEEYQLGEMNSWTVSNAVSINLANKNSYYSITNEKGILPFRVDKYWTPNAKRYGYFDLINLFIGIGV